MTVRGAVGDSTRTAKTTRIPVAFQSSIRGCHDSRKRAQVQIDLHVGTSRIARHWVNSEYTVPTPRPGFWHLDDHRHSEYAPVTIEPVLGRVSDSRQLL